MVYHDEPIPKTKTKKTIKPKMDQSDVAQSEDGRTYVIDCLNLGKPVNDSKNDSG